MISMPQSLNSAPECDSNNDVCVIQFAKLPQLNRVKTRMQPWLSVEQSLQLHCDLVGHTFQNLYSPKHWDYQLWVSARQTSPDFFDEMLGSAAVPVKVQQGGDLGARMGHSLEQVLHKYSLAIIVGSDCPALDMGQLNELIRVLREGVPAALIPAQDGGYVALGLSQFSSVLFQKVDWGTAQVYDQTMARIEELGWSFYGANPLADIDRPDDLVQLRDYDWGRKWLALAPIGERG